MAIRKGFSSVWQSREQVDRLLPAIAAAGFDGIEPTLVPGALPSVEDPVPTARELRRRCDDLGLAIPSLRGGRFFWDTVHHPDPERRQAAVDYGRRALDALAEMGGRVLLVVPGQRREDVPYSDHWRRVVDFARALGDAAAGRGLVVGLENVEARFPVSVREWHELLATIDHPAVRMYLDVGNVVWLDLGYPDHWIRELAPVLCQVHFKDAHRGGILRNLLAGEVDWAAVARALRAIGYDGWVLCEPEWYAHAPERLPARLAADMDAILALE